MTTTPDARRTILVGIDGSTLGKAALTWAAAEADRSGVPLHVVHVFVHVRTVGGHRMYDDDTPQEVGGKILSPALERVRAAHPQLEVSSEVLVGGIAEELLRAGRDAAMIVVGARGYGRFTGMFIGSVSQQLAMHATAPVVIVRDGMPAEGRPVVVGVDGSPHATEALRFAARHAAGTGAPVHAVRSEYVERYVAVPAAAWDLTVTEEQRRVAELVDRETATVAKEFPGVTIEVKVDPRHPVRAILDESEDASLVVLGSRGLGGFAGLLLGSVSQGVLAKAPVTVAIVPPVED